MIRFIIIPPKRLWIILFGCLIMRAVAGEEPAEVLSQQRGSGLFRGRVSGGFYYDLGVAWERPSWAGQITVTATNVAQYGKYWLRTRGHVGARLELRAADGRRIGATSQDARSQWTLPRETTIQQLLTGYSRNQRFDSYVLKPEWITAQFDLKRDFGVDGSKESFVLTVTPLLYRAAQDGVRAQLVELPPMEVRLPANGGIPTAYNPGMPSLRAGTVNSSTAPPRGANVAPEQRSQSRSGRAWLIGSVLVSFAMVIAALCYRRLRA